MIGILYNQSACGTPMKD